ncbi:MAG: glycosyltransferase [Gammaproteobacteria bacterium]
MRKLLILTDTVVGGRTGGAESHLWNLLLGLDTKTCSVDVIYFDADNTLEDPSDTQHLSKLPNINFQRIPVKRVYAPSSVKHLIKIHKIMKAGEYDCAMSFFETSDVVVGIVGYLAGIKMRISNRRDTGFRNSKKLAVAYRVVNKFFTHFIAVSSAVKDSIIDQGVSAEKVRVIYNAVDLKRFQNLKGNEIRKQIGIKTNEQIFGMVANLYPVKNHSSVISALKILHGKGKNAHLVLAGEGYLQEQLEEQVSSLSLKSYVHFLGPRDDIEHVLDAIDAFVLASHTEGLSNALLEAMAAKKPTIASCVGGNVEVVEEGVDGFLVSTEADSILVAMEKLFDSKTLRTEMGLKGLEHVKRQFSYEKMMASYMEIINKKVSVNELKHPASSIL